MSFFSNRFVFMLYMLLLLKHFIESGDSGNRRAAVRSVHTAVHSGLQDEQLHKYVLVHPNVTNN